MSSWIYRKPEPTHVQGLCVLCIRRKQKRRIRNGKVTYNPLCSQCENKRYGYVALKKSERYRRHKGLSCTACGFIAIDRCQLDVHHVDGNHHNNDPNNLQTLCANCHRLKHCTSKRKTRKAAKPSGFSCLYLFV